MKMLVSFPEVGQKNIIDLKGLSQVGAVELNLLFNPSDVVLVKQGNDLILQSPNKGQILLENYQEVENNSQNLYILVDEKIISYPHFLQYLESEDWKHFEDSHLRFRDRDHHHRELELGLENGLSIDLKQAEIVSPQAFIHKGQINDLINLVPTISSYTHEFIEDNASLLWQGNVLTNAQAGDGTTLLSWKSLLSEYGTFTVDDSGKFTYFLDNTNPFVQALGLGESITEYFYYTYTDTHGDQALGKLEIIIKGTNDIPTVESSTAQVFEDTLPQVTGTLPIPHDVDTNDTFQVLAQQIVGKYGILQINSDGTYTYILDNNRGDIQALAANEQGTDVFTFQISDGHGGIASNTLTVTIFGTNDLPIIQSASAGVQEDTKSIITGTLPLPLDIDVADTLHFIPFAQVGQYGNIALGEDGRYIYTLNNASLAVQSIGADESRDEVFTYAVTDDKGGISTATLTITIHGTNDNPTISSATDAVKEDVNTEVVGQLPLPEDVDTHDQLVFNPFTQQGLYGSITVDNQGHYTYHLDNSSAIVQQLKAGETRTEVFTYTVVDGKGGVGQNTLTIVVEGTNDRPTANSFDINTGEDTQNTLTGTLPLATEVDLNDPHSFQPLTLTGLYGVLVIDMQGNYTYTLNNQMPEIQSLGVGDYKLDKFTYVVNDSSGGNASNTFSVLINGSNDMPTVSPFDDTVIEDLKIVTEGTLPLPTDVDTSDVLSFTPFTQNGIFGSLTVDSQGHYVYTLNNNSQEVQSIAANETRIDLFIYTVTDDSGGSTTNTLTFYVSGTNDLPTVSSKADFVAEDTKTIAIGLLPLPTDVDTSDVLSFTPLNITGLYGTFSLTSNGEYKYVLNNNSSLIQSMAVGDTYSESFVYTVIDNKGGTVSNTFSLTIQGTNDTPKLSAYTTIATEDNNTLLSGFLPTPTDVDTGSNVEFVGQSHFVGEYGVFTLLSNGEYTYTLNNSMSAIQGLSVGDVLQDKITVQVRDDTGDLGSSTFTVTIQGTNDIPVATPTFSFVSEDTLVTTRGTLLPGTDVDIHDTLSFMSQTNVPTEYGFFTLQANGSYTYTLNNSNFFIQSLGKGESITENIPFTLKDNNNAQSSGFLTITINGTNDAPQVAAAATLAQEDIILINSGQLPIPTDVDAHDTLSFLAKNKEPGEFGTLTLQTNGTYTYELNNGLKSIQSLGVGESLTERFLYTVVDQHGAIGQNILTVTINGNNDLPIAVATGTSVKEDSTLVSTGSISSAVRDMDSQDTLSFTPQSISGQYGTFVLQNNGQYSYTLNNVLGAVQGLTTGESLEDRFLYTVQDNHGGITTQVMTVTVQGTNDLPYTTAAVNSVQEDVHTQVTGSLNPIVDTDNTADLIQSDITRYTAITNGVGTYGILNLNSDGTYTYSLNNSLKAVQDLGAGESVQERFTYAVYDEHGGYTTNTLTITVNGTHDKNKHDNDDDHYDFANKITGKDHIVSLPAINMSSVEDQITSITGNASVSSTFLLNQNANHTFFIHGPSHSEYGDVSMSPDGSYTFTLDNTAEAVQNLEEGETVHLRFYYGVSTGVGLPLFGYFDVAITGTAELPQAQVIPLMLTEDAFSFLTGSIQPENIANNYSFNAEENTGDYGTFILNSNGTYLYILNNESEKVQSLGVGEQGIETFAYTLKDEHGNSSTSYVQVTVKGTNDVPVAQVAYQTLTEDSLTLVTGQLVATDRDSHDTLSFIPQTNIQGLYGVLTIASNGQYTYTLNNTLPIIQSLGIGESITETFTYEVKDSHNAQSSSSLVLTIEGSNDLPTLNPLVLGQVQEDVQQVISGVLPRPVDMDSGDSVKFVAADALQGQYGTLFITAGGAYTYTLNSHLVQHLGVGESVKDTLIYSTIDNHNGIQNNAIEITIFGTNDAPLLAPQSGSVNANIPALLGVISGADVDINNVLTYTLVDNTSTQVGQYGTLHLASDGTYSYVVNTNLPQVLAMPEGERLVEYFDVKVSDGSSTATNRLSIVVEGVNDAPKVIAALNSINEGSLEVTGTLPVLVDVDRFDSADYIVQNQMPTEYGTFTLNSDGSYVYQLDNNNPAVQSLGVGETLTDTFYFTGKDIFNAQTQNMFTLTITGTNDIPVAYPEISHVKANVFNFTGNVSGYDVDTNDILSYTLVGNSTSIVGEYGTLSMGSTGEYTYTLNTSAEAILALNSQQSLTETFDFQIHDNHNGSSTQVLTFNIHGVNDAPIISPAINSMSENSLTVTGLLNTPLDKDFGDIANYIPQENIPTTYGLFTLQANGSYTYELDQNNIKVQNLSLGQTLIDTFPIQGEDIYGAQGTNVFTLTIHGTDTIPTVFAEPLMEQSPTLLIMPSEDPLASMLTPSPESLDTVLDATETHDIPVQTTDTPEVRPYSSSDFASSLPEMSSMDMATQQEITKLG